MNGLELLFKNLTGIQKGTPKGVDETHHGIISYYQNSCIQQKSWKKCMYITQSNKTHHILSMHCIAISDQLAFSEKKYNPLEAIYLTSMWCNATLQNCLNIKCIFPLSSLQETHKANCNNSWQDITKLLTPTNKLPIWLQVQLLEQWACC